ncbi:ADP-ribose pyrophosphatase [Microdochium bolleyi]|uniref:ADP-ribose pyrophosphatase n=1 Tax=Microdochium bolleyi TaxID=196109 RepID=A0A136IPV5_9PEZI|nr:ADP-ribose pyrophosphatase [Microdochium bolleyi]
MAANNSKVVSVEPLDTKDAKWLQLVKVNYTDPAGNPRTWEATRRTTKPRDSPVDSIHILAVLEKQVPGGSSSTVPHILLEKQFRPPAGKVTVEFPAGLVDAGETAEQAAVRELREETGYVGSVLPDPAEVGGRRMVIHGSPASSSSCTYMIHLSIDPSLPENQNPAPKLEPDEFIECFWLPLRDLHAELRQLEATGHYAIDGKLASFAEGLAVAAAWKM